MAELHTGAVGVASAAPAAEQPRGLTEAMAIVAAMSGVGPDVEWIHGDDLCDCTFQRIGWWTNPYIGATLLVRMCCIWEAIYAQYPQFVQRVDAFNDYNADVFTKETRDWDSTDADMPRALWYRQIAHRTGLTLAEVRVQYADQEPPRRLRAAARA